MCFNWIETHLWLYPMIKLVLSTILGILNEAHLNDVFNSHGLIHALHDIQLLQVCTFVAYNLDLTGQNSWAQQITHSMHSLVL